MRRISWPGQQQYCPLHAESLWQQLRRLALPDRTSGPPAQHGARGRKTCHLLGPVNGVQNGDALKRFGEQAGDAQRNKAGCNGADDEDAEVFGCGQGEGEQADFVRIWILTGRVRMLKF